MACLHAKRLFANYVHNPLTARLLYRVGSASPRFFSSMFRIDDSDEFNCKLKPPTNCRSSRVLCVVNEAFCPRISATRNMARILNWMDYEAGVAEPSESSCPRWDVFQDAKALYIVRDMTRLPRKDEIYREADDETYGPDTQTVFGCTRVGCFGGTVTLIVGQYGPYPGAAYPGYRVVMRLPANLNSVWDIKMGVKNEILTIIIPKEKKGMWLHRFTMLPDFFSPEL